MKNKALAVIFVVLLFSGCSSKKERYIPEVEKSRLPEVNIKIKRYGKAIFSLDTNNPVQELEKIKPEFPLFLDADLNNPENVNKIKNFITDSVNRKLFQRTEKIFPNLNDLEKQLSEGFSHLLYFFPDEKTPTFYSYISGLYYEQPVIIFDTVVLIGLDNYLGQDCKLYDMVMIPHYKSRWMIKEEIPVDVMKTVYDNINIYRTRPTNLLDMMINEGKKMVFIDAMYPEMPDTIKIRYTKKQLEWVKENEKNIWAFIISQKLLFSANFKQANKLIQDGPFTNGFSRESPARLGVYIGWQIVSDFMKNNKDVSLKDLLKIKDSQMILKKSYYKP